MACMHEWHERAKPWDPGQAAQRLCTRRLVVCITKVNAYNDEVTSPLDEEAKSVEEDGYASLDPDRNLTRSKVGLCVEYCT